MRERFQEGLLKRIYHSVFEKVVALVEPESRERVVLKVTEAKNDNWQPSADELHHYQHIPRNEIKRILTVERAKNAKLEELIDLHQN